MRLATTGKHTHCASTVILTNLIIRLLHLPTNSLPLIVCAASELHPKIKELSVLIEKHLLHHLLDQSRPNIGALRAMLARARELDLQAPFTKVIDSMRVSTTADPENQRYARDLVGMMESVGSKHGAEDSTQGEATEVEVQAEDSGPSRKRKNGKAGDTRKRARKGLSGI